MIRLTPSGVPTTLVLVNCYQVGVPGLGPGGVPRESHYGHWMEQGGTLEASSSSPFLLTSTLANLDYLLGQKPGFLSGPPLPILEIEESVGCPGPFPKPFGQGRSQWHLCNNVCHSPICHRNWRMHFILGVSRGSPHPPFLLFLRFSSPGLLSSRVTSQAHKSHQAISALHRHHPLWLRGRVNVAGR